MQGIEIAGAQETRELDGIAAVGLDAVAGPAWNERRGHHATGDAARGQVPVEDVAAGPGLVGDLESVGLFLEPAEELIEVGGAGADPAEVGDLARRSCGT